MPPVGSPRATRARKTNPPTPRALAQISSLIARAPSMSRAFALHVCGAGTGLFVKRRLRALRGAVSRRGVAVRATMATPSAREESSSGSSSSPAFRFGLLADIQYVDRDDKSNFTGTQWRRYRNSLVVAKDAVEYFNQHDDLAFVLHNGDIIDHQCAFDFDADAFKPKEEGHRQLADVMRVLSDAKCRDWHFTVGNHELYNFTREELRDGVTADGASLPFRCADAAGDFHYSFAPAPGWRVLVLDAYDVSIYRNGRERGLDASALELLCENNPNCATWVRDNPEVIETERMSGTFPYFKDLSGLQNRWVPFNGGVGDAQLAWLGAQLEEAAAGNERVVVFSHLLVHPGSTAGGSGRTLMWNYGEVLDVLEDPRWAHTVAAVVSGHQHEGGVHTSENGTHFVVMESPMLAEPGHRGPYAVVEAHADRLAFVGFGRGAKSNLFEIGEESSEGSEPLTRTLPLRPRAGASGGGGA